ncbi:MAG: ElyC/SanA/YdcF family protein [Phycisphaerales bacterium]|jgi:uncharacterized SAM-binding protein YcdF (DUF218 family)
MLFWLKKFVSFWIMPLPFCLLAIAAGLFLMTRPRRARLGRALALAGLVLLAVLSNGLVSKWLIRPLQARYPAVPEFVAGAPLPAPLAACQYVVVLGAGNGYSPEVSANNLLSSSAISRVAEGVRLLHALPGAKLIVSGPGTANRPTHATVMARAVIALGIARDRIVTIDQARDTEDEVHHVHRLVAGAPVALVTSAWHMPRAMALFRSVGLAPLPCPADYRAHTDDAVVWDDFLCDAESLARSTFALRERIGYLWIWLRGKT